jgi:hypothetical protein
VEKLADAGVARLDFRDLCGHTVHEKASARGRALLEHYGLRFGLDW